MLKKYHREKSTAVLGPGANVENPVLRLNPPAAEDATRGDDDDPTEDPKAAKVVVVVVVVVVFLSAANPFCLRLLLSPIQFIKVDFFE